MLTSERIAEVRACVRCDVRASVLDDAEIILDAYEASRPRPASEVPPKGMTVIVRYGHTVDGVVSAGRYVGHDGYGHVWNTDRSGRIFGHIVRQWWTLPEVPE
jgi:hypothetical protein